jgi:hypothetical protein
VPDTGWRGNAPPAFHVMVKPRGSICNLHCEYCYFLAKEALCPGSDFHMPAGLLGLFTRQYIEAQQAPEVTFGWQGGEPTLMRLDFFRLAVELQEKYRRPGVRSPGRAPARRLRSSLLQRRSEWPARWPGRLASLPHPPPYLGPQPQRTRPANRYPAWLYCYYITGGDGCQVRVCDQPPPDGGAVCTKCTSDVQSEVRLTWREPWNLVREFVGYYYYLVHPLA